MLKALSLFTVLLFFVSCSEEEAMVSPAVTMPNLNKYGLVSINQVCKEQPNNKVALKFFASWCPGCQQEHGAVKALSTMIPTIGVAYKNDNDEAISWLNQQNYNFSHIGYDKDGYVGASYGIFGLPETILIGCKNSEIEKLYHKKGIYAFA